jgi:hypothetical protein
MKRCSSIRPRGRKPIRESAKRQAISVTLSPLLIRELEKRKRREGKMSHVVENLLIQALRPDPKARTSNREPEEVATLFREFIPLLEVAEGAHKRHKDQMTSNLWAEEKAVRVISKGLTQTGIAGAPEPADDLSWIEAGFAAQYGSDLDKVLYFLETVFLIREMIRVALKEGYKVRGPFFDGLEPGYKCYKLNSLIKSSLRRLDELLLDALQKRQSDAIWDGKGRTRIFSRVGVANDIFSPEYLRVHLIELTVKLFETDTNGKSRGEGFIGACPRCLKIFRKTRTDQIYDRKTCREAASRQRTADLSINDKD